MTKRFEYTDVDGILKEAEAFIASEFVTTSAPNSPVMTGPGGQIHPSLLPSVLQAKASSLVITRIATGTILRGDLVRASTFNHVTISDPTGTLEEAYVFGMAMADADDSEEVEVLLLGVITDPLFSVFAVNSTLFLDETGGVTDIRPSKPSKNFSTIIGKALGGNEILVNIQTPVTLSE